MCTYMCIYIYIHIEREREKEREIHTYIYIYIYTHNTCVYILVYTYIHTMPAKAMVIPYYCWFGLHYYSVVVSLSAGLEGDGLGRVDRYQGAGPAGRRSFCICCGCFLLVSTLLPNFTGNVSRWSPYVQHISAIVSNWST